MIRTTTKGLLIVLSGCALSTCTRAPTPTPPTRPVVHANFTFWRSPDGSQTFWQLAIPPESWRVLGNGVQFDPQHQQLPDPVIAKIRELADKTLAHRGLCAGTWHMVDVRKIMENGYLTFMGLCDPPGTKLDGGADT